MDILSTAQQGDRTVAPTAASKRLPSLNTSLNASSKTPLMATRRSLSNTIGRGEQAADTSSSQQSQGAGERGIDLGKVLRLLKEEHTLDLVERHVHALRKVVRTNPNGLHAQDLDLLAQILHVLADCLRGRNDAYLEPTQAIVHLFDMPFRSAGTQQHVLALKGLVNVFEAFVHLLDTPALDAVLAVLDNLTWTAVQDADTQRQRLGLAGPHYCASVVAALSQSQVPSKLVMLLASQLRSGDEQMSATQGREVNATVLFVLRRLSSLPDCQPALVAVHCLPHALELAGETRASDETVGLLVDIAWNLLDSETSAEACVQQLSQSGRVALLSDVFFRLVRRSSESKKTRQLRNDVLSIIVELSNRQIFVHAAHDAGLDRKLLMTLAAGDVRGARLADGSRVKLSNSSEDFEFQKMIFVVCQQMLMSGSKLSASALEDCFALALIKLYLQVPTSESFEPPRPWSQAEYNELQLLALTFLRECGRLLSPQQTQAHRLLTVLLVLLQWASQTSPSSMGFGSLAATSNAFHAAGDLTLTAAQKPQAGSIMRAHSSLCLACLRRLSTPPSDQNDVAGIQTQLYRDMVDQGGLEVLLAILDAHPVEHSTMTQGSTFRLQKDTLLLLRLVLDADKHHCDLAGSRCVALLLDMLRVERSSPISPLAEEVMLCALAALRPAVFGSSLCRAAFMDDEGCFLLLDVMERRLPRLIRTCVALLLDLVDSDEECLQHVRAWQSQTSTACGSLRLVIGLFASECSHVGSLPLTVQQPIRRASGSERLLLAPAKSAAKVHGTSPSVKDLISNARAGLCLLHSKLLRSADAKALAGLTADERLVQTVMQQFLNLKACEVWKEITTALYNSVEPTEVDADVLRIARVTEEDVYKMLEAARQLFQREESEQHQTREAEDLDRLSSMAKQQSQAERSFADFVSRTSRSMVNEHDEY